MRPGSASKGDSPARLLYFVIKDDQVVYKTTVISKAMAKMLPKSILAEAMISMDEGGTFHKGSSGISAGTTEPRKSKRRNPKAA